MSTTVSCLGVFPIAAFPQVCIGAYDRTKRLASDCAITWGNCGPVADMLSTIFIRLGLQFMLAWAFPKVALALPQPIWDMVGVLVDRAKLSLKDTASRIALQQLKERNEALEEKIQEAVKQRDVFQFDNGRLSWEKKQETEEKARLLKEREALILERAPLLIEKDQLREERDRLIQEKEKAKEENQRLIIERDESLHKLEGLEASYHRSLEKQSELRILLDQVEDYKALNRHLERFHEMYMRQQETGEEGATLLALKKLLPSYEAHREKLHQVLQEAIDKLPDTDLGKASLRGILRISQEEMKHVTKISESCHLLEELREPIAKYFSQAQRKKRGAVYG